MTDLDLAVVPDTSRQRPAGASSALDRLRSRHVARTSHRARAHAGLARAPRSSPAALFSILLSTGMHDDVMMRAPNRRPRSRRSNGVMGTVAFAVAAASVGLPAGSAAAAGVVAQWPMSETSGTVMHDTVSPTFENRTIGPLVVLSGDSYEFPGWRDNVTASGQLQGSVSVDGGIVAVPNPDDVFDPNSGFSMVTALRARVTADGHLPARATNGDPPSYNVVQKGRANSPGGFWKLEIAGSGRQIGKIRCVAGDGQVSKVAMSATRVDDGAWHTVGCELSGGKLTAIVNDEHRSVTASTLGPIHPGGQWGTSMWIGKKPGSTDPADAFAGWLHDLTISIL
jgi:hypothetical protein